MTTHYWAYQPSHPAYRHGWPTIINDTRLIIDHVRGLSIVIAGPDGHRGPILDPGEVIGFNGDATTDLAGDSFTLLAPLPGHPRGLPTATARCTTNRKPYELAVTAVLLRCALLVPAAFAVGSDGRWDGEWRTGARQWPAAATGHSPRSIVADLFGTNPVGNPLREDIIGAGLAGPSLEPTRIQVYDVEHDVMLEVTPAETVAGLFRYARTLGPGTPAAGVAEQRAIELAQQHGLSRLSPRGGAMQ